MRIKELHLGDEKYPIKLSRRLNKKAPKTLYCMGNLELLELQGIGFCGSREASEKAIYAAEACTQELIANDMVAVSGYARGVDEAVHLAALKSGGTTIIVLPEGIDHFTIRKSLESAWDWERVLVISEFEPTAGWQAFRAMQRNSTIIGLSEAMIVVEAREKGGTMEAGKQTLKLQRPLFTLSYKDPSTSGGNLELQKKGAKPLGKHPKTDKPNMQRVFEAICKLVGYSNPSYQPSFL